MDKLSKYITHGALVIATIGAALTLSQAAKAGSFTVENALTPGFKDTVGDKIFSDFNITGTTVDREDLIAITFTSGVYQLNYDAQFGANKTLTTEGILSYKITIDPSYTNLFDMAGTNAQGSTLPGRTFNKNLELVSGGTLDPNPIAFTSTGGTVFGNFLDPKPQIINIKSSWKLNNTDSFINSFSDQYVQIPLDPTTRVPEPSGVLGLVAFGLVGLVSRAVSKSVGK